MGKPKALLDWGGQCLVNYQVEQLREAGCDEVIVVLGHKADDVSRQMRTTNCRTMLNPRYAHGRAGSLRIGAKAVNRDTDAILIVNVDQPRPAEFLRALITAHDPKHAATRPTFEGHTGHPIVVSGWLRPELLEAKDESDGLRGILHAHVSELGEFVAGELAVLDVNTPEEYQAAVARWAPVASA